MIDLYTKLVLTVIAGALIALTGMQMLPSALAQSAGCGGIGNPCYVAVGYMTGTGKYSPCYAESPCAKK